MTKKTYLIPDQSGPGIKTAALPSEPSREESGKCATGDEWRDEKNLRIKIAKVENMIGTWNVRTLRQCGKMEVSAQEMDRMVWHVLGISQMRWKEIGEGTTEDSGTVVMRGSVYMVLDF